MVEETGGGKQVIVETPTGSVEATLLSERGGRYQCRLADGRVVWVPPEKVSSIGGGPVSVPPPFGGAPPEGGAAPYASAPYASAPYASAEVGTRVPAKKGMSATTVLLILVGVFVGLIVLGIFASLAVYGVQKYVANQKGADIRAQATTLAQGMCECAGPRGAGAFPDSSKLVPAQRPSGTKAEVQPGEFTDAGFCSGVSAPVYAQFGWVRESESTGYVSAVADLDGDGQVEASEPSFRVMVEKNGGTCAVGQTVDVAPDGSEAPRPTVAANAFVTSDGLWTVPDPGGYRLITEEASPDSSLFIGNPQKELYLVVISESTADMVVPIGLAEYEKAVEENLKAATSEGGWAGRARAIRVDGHPGTQRRYDAVTDNLRLSYMMTLVQTPGHVHQIMQWTLRSRYDTAEAGFARAAESLRLAR